MDPKCYNPYSRHPQTGARNWGDRLVSELMKGVIPFRLQEGLRVSGLGSRVACNCVGYLTFSQFSRHSPQWALPY